VSKSVCYVMPSGYPSGGNKMVVEHVKRLGERGREVAVSIVSEHVDDDFKWLQLGGVKVVPFNKESLDKFGHVVATYWETKYMIDNLGLVGPEHHYFVQSKEDEFECHQYRKQMVLLSLMDKKYSLFTEAKWLKQFLLETLHRDCVLVPNNIELPNDLDLVKKPRNKPVVLIEGEATTWWKNIEDGAKVARLLRPEVDVWLLTNTKANKIHPNYYMSFEKTFICVSWREALELIAQADVVYRPSLLEGFNGCASEAMLLGTPTVVNNIPASFEAGVSGWNCLMCKQKDVYDAVDNIHRLLKDKDLYEKIRVNGIATAKEQFTDWNKSIDVLDESVFC
jgi:glycosyltransferase involved in cell wall biosynthesis